MRRMRIAVLMALIFIVVAGAGLLVLSRTFQPVRHGIELDAFATNPHDAPSVESVVSPLESPGAPPNIVIILADDLGYGDLGVHGARAIRTPNVDRLAAEGLRLTNFYASAPVCSPSRAGLLTGRYPLRSGIVTAMQMAGDTPVRKLMYQLGIGMSHLAAVDMLGGGNAVIGLPRSEITIPEALNVAGYRSMAVGKWHLGDFTEWPEYHPYEHGFDEFVGFIGSNDDFPVAFWRGSEQVIADIGAEQSAYTRIFTEEAVGFIERTDERPFFLYLAHKDPHLPFYPAEPFAGTSDGGPYGDAVAEFDWSVGEVVAALERRGIAKNTLVIVTSDNGPWFDGSAGGLRGRKGQSYEGGFRVPFVAWWPDTIPRGAVHDAPAMNIDLLPTCLALAGVSLPNDRIVDGVDLGGLLRAGEAPPTRSLYYFHDYDIEAVRRDAWKYYRSTSHWVWPVPLDKPDSLVGPLAGARDYTPPGSSESIPTLGTLPLLYHLERDPDESYNVLKAEPDVAAQLGQELEDWRETFYTNPRGWW